MNKNGLIVIAILAAFAIIGLNTMNKSNDFDMTETATDTDSGMFDDLKQAANDVADDAAELAENAAEVATDAAADATDATVEAANTVADKASDVATDTANLAETAADKTAEMATDAVDATTNAAADGQSRSFFCGRKQRVQMEEAQRYKH